ncbi:glycosyltransferase family 4 protein [Rhodovulum visakhapatnamense]|uniref:Glycosyltransferase involved in cell wall biosynthesis n=1 Tax=Rhodovulum visakhapatnamense TaxID=364297 RepID=A0A4R8FEQ3_9RHOB|nr:glycosyltransferase [Rhodovulum visakhapatnamense]TDX22238.1 glycosyltransferase involved in cell wall biosynthesis [Rhodovulum visakhapatnamense]
MTRLSVLAIAEAANPEWVSVPLVGWSLAHALRKVADVHLVTQIRNREAITRTGLVEGRDFTVIDSEALARPMYRAASLLRMGAGKGWTMNTAINALAYPYFERLVWNRFGEEIRSGRYDIVHRITPLSPTVASPLAPKVAGAGVPFVLGPLNGGVPWPKGFAAERRREREWLSHVRAAYKINPARGRTLNAASAILAGSRHTGGEIPARFQNKVFWLPENAIDPDRFSLVSEQDISAPLRACFIGRMVPYKGPDMLLEAAAGLLRSGRLVLDMIGDGPMLEALKAQADKAGLADAVAFHGNLPHRQVQTVAARANLFTFPSIREFGGGAVLEAMALGVVPVIADYAGPGELVRPETGYKVPLGSRDEIVARFRSLLEEIVSDPSALPQMATAARTHALTCFTWDAKARQVAQVYEWVLKGGPRPEPVPMTGGSE